jgi:protein phosphatase
MNWTSHALTHPGNLRTTNQDAFFCHDQHALWVVADGMGGHDAGEIASQTIVQSLANLTQSGAANTTVANITSMLEDVNEQLFAQYTAHQRLVGSTIAMMQIKQDQCCCMWAGDSRIYRLRAGKLQQISVDHSYVQELINQGELSEKDAANHKNKNVITRAIGVAATLQIEIKNITVQEGDLLLLCSDGLYNEIEAAELAAILAFSSAKQAAAQLLELCLSREAKDNVSFVIVEVQ